MGAPEFVPRGCDLSVEAKVPEVVRGGRDRAREAEVCAPKVVPGCVTLP